MNHGSNAKSHADSLALSRSVLRVLIKLNIGMGVFILALLIATLVLKERALEALGILHSPDPATYLIGVRTIMVLGIASIPVTHIVLTRLLSIVETVNDGSPFVLENTQRLRVIAWAVLSLELMSFVIRTVADMVSTSATPLNLNAGLSVTRWLAVLLLFVLARVFEQGARMREDLEGTV